MSRLTHASAALLGGVVGAASVALLGGHIGSNWGDVATWFGAVGTVGALSASAVQAGRATEQLELMRDEREHMLRQQARLILVTTSLDPQRPTRATFYVANRSGAPITALRLVSAYLRHLGDAQPQGCELEGVWMSSNDDGVLAFDMSPSLSVAGQDGPFALQPGESLAVAATFRDALGRAVPLDESDHRVAPTLDVEFVDSTGVRWAKWQNLEPRRSPNPAVHREPPPPIPWQ